jgi:hypothetical protein
VCPTPVTESDRPFTISLRRPRAPLGVGPGRSTRSIRWAAPRWPLTRVDRRQCLERDQRQVAPVAAAGSFPVTLAGAYAAEFGRVYLNFNPQNQNQGQREQRLAAFVSASVAAADPDLGWNGVGQMSLQSEQVAGITVQDPAHAVVTLLASVNGQMMELGVPVAASGNGVVVSGEPAWLPAPAQIPLPASAAGASDPAAQSQPMN